MTRVLVCGPRDMTDYWLVFEVLDGQHKAAPITCIIEGGANGADRFSRAWAERRGVPHDPCPVDHKLDGPWPGAGPRRNWRMFKTKAPDRVIAFVATPPTPGTSHMVKVAKRGRLPVLEIVLEEGMGEILVQVCAPHFVAGLVVTDGRCTDAAPILRKACIGKSSQQLRNYFIRRGWKAVIVPSPRPADCAGVDVPSNGAKVDTKPGLDGHGQDNTLQSVSPQRVGSGC